MFDTLYSLPAHGTKAHESGLMPGGLLETCCSSFPSPTPRPADCLAAYEHEHRDYEDDLVAYSAHRTGIDFIVTRNGRDFEKSPVPVLSPTEFVDLFKPADIVYGWETLPPE